MGGLQDDEHVGPEVVPLLTHMDATIEERAGSIATEYDALDERGCVNVHKLVGELGGDIEVAFESIDHPESLQVRSRGDFTVIVPWNTSRSRDRFTIAHELGHYFLHYSEGDDARSFYRYGRSRQEAEANAFAAALLMPAEFFTTAWAELGGDLRTIAERFGVSFSAANVRAQVLGLTQ